MYVAGAAVASETINIVFSYTTTIEAAAAEKLEVKLQRLRYLECLIPRSSNNSPGLRGLTTRRRSGILLNVQYLCSICEK